MKTKMTTLLLALVGSAIFIVNPIFAADLINTPIEKQWGKSIAGYALSISTSKTNYSAGEPIAVKISIKNIGTNTVVVAETYSLELYDPYVTLTNHQVVPPTLKGRQTIKNFRETTGSLNLKTLNVGEELISDYPLNEIFDLTAPGVYRIKLGRKFRDAAAISNEIEITIGQ